MTSIYNNYYHEPSLFRKYQPEEEDVDAPDESLQNSGEEWPDFEHPDVARYRRFYQVSDLTRIVVLLYDYSLVC